MSNFDHTKLDADDVFGMFATINGLMNMLNSALDEDDNPDELFDLAQISIYMDKLQKKVSHEACKPKLTVVETDG